MKCINCNIEMNEKHTVNYLDADCVSRERCKICSEVVAGYCRGCRDRKGIITTDTESAKYYSELYDTVRSIRDEHIREHHYPVDMI